MVATMLVAGGFVGVAGEQAQGFEAFEDG
jgi:hypothetical protein